MFLLCISGDKNVKKENKIMAFNKIYVEPSAGVYIGDFMKELYALSVKYECDVNAKFNGKEIIVKQNKNY